MTVWTHTLPHGLAGRSDQEPAQNHTEIAGINVPCRTPIKVWPVLACCQGDTPFLANASQTCHHSGYHACWRCGMISRGEGDDDDETGGTRRWWGYDEDVYIPALCIANPMYTGPQLDAQGLISVPERPHATLPHSTYCLPTGYIHHPAGSPGLLRWQYERSEVAPMQVRSCWRGCSGRVWHVASRAKGCVHDVGTGIRM